MQPDLSKDYLVWDFPEAIGYDVARRGGVYDSDSVNWAKRRAVTNQEVFSSNGRYTRQDLVWLLPATVMTPGLSPKPADVVVDSDLVRWTVLQVAWNRVRQTWRLTTRNLVLAFDLRDKVTVERAVISYDPAGVPVKEWRSLYTDLPCRVQPLNSDVREGRGIAGWHTPYRVPVDREVAVTNEDRLRWKDPAGRTRYLDITGYSNPETLDNLSEILAELRP